MNSPGVHIGGPWRSMVHSIGVAQRRSGEASEWLIGVAHRVHTSNGSRSRAFRHSGRFSTFPVPSRAKESYERGPASAYAMVHGCIGCHCPVHLKLDVCTPNLTYRVWDLFGACATVTPVPHVRTCYAVAQIDSRSNGFTCLFWYKVHMYYIKGC